MNAQKVFGCGIDDQIFKKRYDTLSESTQNRLERVANRAWLTLKLRYEMGFFRNPFSLNNEEYSLFYVEMPSIRVYLLCTCLDTLAGKDTYKEFDIWLRDQERNENLNIENVIQLYKQYKKEYGVGRNLRDLFETLPQTIKDWLAKNVMIKHADDDLALTEQQNEKLMKRLYTFFYDVWRNQYTHSSKSRQTSIPDDIQEPMEGDEWWVTPAEFMRFPLHKNQEWSFSYRQGLDLETILRVIIHSVVLQNLNIEVTNEIISTNLRNLSKLDGLSAFIYEVNSNSDTLVYLSTLDELELRNLCLRGIPLLRVEASTIMLERYDIPSNAGFHEMTMEYITKVKNLNDSFAKFNVENPHVKRPTDYTQEHFHAIKGFLEKRTQKSDYQSVMNWSSRVEMTNVRSLMHDPCYSIFG